MKKRLVFIPVLICLSFGLLLSQVSPDKSFRLDPALDEIIARDAKLEVLGEHFGLTEGPV
jgi:hypothetical protein